MKNNQPIVSHESYYLNGSPEELALNFPPTEIDRRESDTYVEADPATLSTFLYPTNVTRRDYQFEISQECFHQNTLVCLPTGAGKTLIAAVAMMNFHRWFPKGIIIFMATTRNLVTQQIDACTSFTNIPQSKVTTIIGTSTSKGRSSVWDEYTVFFCTPQIVQNDIEKKRLDPSNIILLIFDEAHHAHGNYAYSRVVRLVAARTSQFRVIGLSATPGNNMNSIQTVIFNLMISKVIYKDDNDPDIAKYQHKTDIEIVTVPLGGDETLLMNFLGQCMTKIAEQLQAKGLLRTSNPQNLTHGLVWVSMNNFQKQPGEYSKDKFFLLDLFGILNSLSFIYEKLLKYGAEHLNEGLKDFMKKRKDTESKRKLVTSPAFQSLLRYSEQAKNISHPKLAKLSIILSDFYENNPSSRSIIFTQFRAVAYAIVKHLENVPLVKPSIFIGKSTTKKNEGLTDATQLEVVSLFRKGSINCIVATSVGEEGLDIGEVDLIICFDTSASPLKTVQRMGRTGRKRAGRVVFLMTEGYEEKNLDKVKNTKSYIKSKLTTDLSKFVLYHPKISNVPIPNNLSVINLKCLQNEKRIHVIDNNNDTKSPFLQKNELYALECCFGRNLKYHKFRVSTYDSNVAVITHSAESNILSSIYKQCKIGQNDEEDEDIESLIRKLSQNVESNDNNVENPFMIDSDDESDNDRKNTPCMSLAEHLASQRMEENDFLSDDDDDLYIEEIEHLESSKQIKQTDENAFLSDDDSDDKFLDESDDITIDDEIEVERSLCNRNRNSEVPIETVMMTPQQSSFLDDSDMDVDLDDI
ncbi:Type III restriction enzyme, res subunit family protein [Histomonas meleagridis]|uniref:Type III restriction enzyme, res subunit family protein n=1 Tax=Histomonas meleagridis TaxID=135588 RepID=UPI00355A2DF8|nr:Type III restriction enzyme, res subunit family protein [Histomonas meleagridis]KAH0801815.1 Type III restriction enzyme, res subunit family protein [Histomonas meleagridis]